MPSNTNIRRQNARYNKPFLAMFSEELLEKTRILADINEMSVATFIRQSVSRNISAYDKTK